MRIDVKQIKNLTLSTITNVDIAGAVQNDILSFDGFTWSGVNYGINNAYLSGQNGGVIQTDNVKGPIDLSPTTNDTTFIVRDSVAGLPVFSIGKDDPLTQVSMPYSGFSFGRKEGLFNPANICKMIIGKADTTNSAKKELLFNDIIGATVSIADDTVIQFALNVVAIQTGGVSGTAGTTFVKTYRGACKNIAGAMSFVGSITEETIAIDIEASTSGWETTISVTSGYLKIEVKGAVSRNINWTGMVQLIETSY